jgi:hypothetical protein
MNENDLTLTGFQEQVASSLTRHKNILDTITKLQVSSARLNRAVVKAATQCGCISIQADKKPLPEDASLEELHELITTGVEWKLCEPCREVVEQEMGTLLYYIAALSNTLGVSMQSAMQAEVSHLSTLGRFSLR